MLPFLCFSCLCGYLKHILRFPGALGVKNPPATAGDPGSIPGLGRSPEEGNGHPLQYSCLGNPMDRGAWQVTVRRVAKSWAQLKRLSTHAGGLLSRQLQQPLCQMASLCSSTSSLYTSPFYSVPTKDAPTCLLASSCVWPTEIIGRR